MPAEGQTDRIREFMKLKYIEKRWAGSGGGGGGGGGRSEVRLPLARSPLIQLRLCLLQCVPVYSYSCSSCLPCLPLPPRLCVASPPLWGPL